MQASSGVKDAERLKLHLRLEPALWLNGTGGNAVPPLQSFLKTSIQLSSNFCSEKIAPHLGEANPMDSARAIIGRHARSTAMAGKLLEHMIVSLTRWHQGQRIS